jgi:hypothetical protein
MKNSPSEFLKKLEEFCEDEGFYFQCSDVDCPLILFHKRFKAEGEHYSFYDLSKSDEFDLMIRKP